MRVLGKDKVMAETGTGFGSAWPPIGHYQFYVKGIQVNPERSPNMIMIELRIITGTVPGQEDLEPTLWLWYDETHPKWGADAAERVHRFFWAVGLFEEGEDADIEPSDAVGKCFVGEVAENFRKLGKDATEKTKIVEMKDGYYWRVDHAAIKTLFKSIDVKPESPAKEDSGATEEEDDELAGL